LNPGKLTQGDSWWGMRFKPHQNWLSEHPMVAAACLNCGLVSLFLVQSELQELRENQPEE